MKLSGKAASDFLGKPPENVWCALVHCEDEGVAADQGAQLFRAWSKGEAERIILTEDELGRDIARLFDTLETRSLLGDARIVMIALSNEKLARHFVSAIESGETNPGRYGARLILMAGQLKSSSKLRKCAENAKHAAALQFFPDSEADMESLVRALIREAGLDIETDALSRLVAGLPGHRRLARAEIEKIALYGHGLGRPLSLSDIQALSATDVDQAVGALVTRSLLGDARGALAELEKLETANTSPITLLRALQRETERLLAAHAQGIGDARGAERLRPPVWRDQWPAFQKQMRLWPEKRLLRILARIHDAEATAKTAGPAAQATLRQLITDLLRTAAS